jgi:HSP20 family protein
MSVKSLIRKDEFLPSVFNNFISPWNYLFDSEFEKPLCVPAVNISETKDEYKVTLAAPGLKKEDFHIHIDRNLLSISAEREDKKEEKENDYTRREYNFSSFSRTFNLPEGVNAEKIEASYHEGILKMTLPKKEEAKKIAAKNIAVN